MKTCLLVIDVQESFRHRPYFSDHGLSAYLAAQNALIRAAQAASTPIVRILHQEGPASPDNPFSEASGAIRPLDGLADFEAAASFRKSRHSALIGTGLEVWLVENGIQGLVISGIRTEQCCETTARHAADLGFKVDFVPEATLTFDMVQPDGQPLTADDIVRRTTTVLHNRFARILSVAEAVERLS